MQGWEGYDCLLIRFTTKIKGKHPLSFPLYLMKMDVWPSLKNTIATYLTVVDDATKVTILWWVRASSFMVFTESPGNPLIAIPATDFFIPAFVILARTK